MSFIALITFNSSNHLASLDWIGLDSPHSQSYRIGSCPRLTRFQLCLCLLDWIVLRALWISSAAFLHHIFGSIKTLRLHIFSSSSTVISAVGTDGFLLNCMLWLTINPQT